MRYPTKFYKHMTEGVKRKVKPMRMYAYRVSRRSVERSLDREFGPYEWHDDWRIRGAGVLRVAR